MLSHARIFLIWGRLNGMVDSGGPKIVHPYSGSLEKIRNLVAGDVVMNIQNKQVRVFCCCS